VWFTSSYSNEGNGCVQVRFDGPDVLVADSKQRGAGPVIRVSGATWEAFVAAVLGESSNADAALRATPAPPGGCTVTAADGTTLEFTAVEWTAFVSVAADGEFAVTAR
jgi:hypothetical protein